MKKLLQHKYLNNLQIKSKLILIYFLCVFLPIISIIFIFYYNMAEQIYEKQEASIQTSMDRIHYNMVQLIAGTVAASSNLYTFRQLYTFIEQPYPTIYSNLMAQRYMEEIIMNYFHAYWQIDNIFIFHNNPYLLSGGYFFYFNNNDLPSWLIPEHTNLPHPLYIITHTEKNKSIISLVRKLSLFQDYNQFSKFVRIDLRKDSLQQILEDPHLDGMLYLIDPQKNIITSSIGASFRPMDKALNPYDLIKNDAYFTFTKEFTTETPFNEWKLLYITPKAPFFSSIQQIRNGIIVLAVVSLLITTLIVLFIARSFTYRLNILTKSMQGSEKTALEPIDIDMGKDEIGLAIKEFNHMTNTIKGLLKDIYEAGVQKNKLELQNTQAKLNALYSQINPHFLFNALNTIRMKSVIKEELETANILKRMGQLFRRLCDWSEEFIPIETELNFIKDFLEIQKYRFDEKLSYKIYMESEAKQYKIPKMLLQPLVENASVHGIEKLNVSGCIQIDIMIQHKSLSIRIYDNGVGMEKWKLKQLLSEIRSSNENNMHIGLKNVYNRLVLYYKNQFIFNLFSEENKGFTVVLVIPLSLLDRIE